MNNLYSRKRYGRCCVVPQCSMKTGTNNLSQIKSHRFPREEKRRSLWVQAIRRENWSPKPSSAVCSLHFIEGKPSPDESHPDYVPNIFPFKPRNKQKEERSVLRLKRLTERRQAQEETSSTNAVVVEDEIDVPSPTTRDIGINSDFTGSHYDTLAAENASLRKRLEKAEKVISTLQSKVEELETVNQQYLGQIVVQNLNHQILMNEDQLKFFTGLQNKGVFNKLLEACLSRWEPSTKTHLEPSHQFLMVLMRLRLGLLIQDLSYRFSVNQSTSSKIVHDWLDIMYHLFEAFVQWPPKKCVRRNLPESFRNDSFRNVRGIIDCTEVFIEKPTNLNARAQTYSSYKGHNTVKFLVVSTPSGAVSFVSQAYGGRATDKHITKDCGLLDLVEPGDVYLVDRGFNCEDVFAAKGATILIPSFTKGKSQLSGEEVLLSRKYSRVRIHVERRIERLKNYRILSPTIPISILKRPSVDGDVCTIDKILLVCAALTNIQRPIIKIPK